MRTFQNFDIYKYLKAEVLLDQLKTKKVTTQRNKIIAPNFFTCVPPMSHNTVALVSCE